jgi:hypothetical protein
MAAAAQRSTKHSINEYLCTAELEDRQYPAEIIMKKKFIMNVQVLACIMGSTYIYNMIRPTKYFPSQIQECSVQY